MGQRPDARTIPHAGLRQHVYPVFPGLAAIIRMGLQDKSPTGAVRTDTDDPVDTDTFKSLLDGVVFRHVDPFADDPP